MTKPKQKAKRKGISQRIRFEVFKRDSFTCQYCGAKAPDVVLHVDHINPVARGGENDLLNLITSCIDCNFGKGARTIDDNSVVVKQRAQLEILNQKRQQTLMMIKWRSEIENVDRLSVDAFGEQFFRITSRRLTDVGEKSVFQWLKTYSIEELMFALDDGSASLDFQNCQSERELEDKATFLFDRCVPIAAVKRICRDDPHLKDLYYVRGIYRNKFGFDGRPVLILQMLKWAYDEGNSIEDLKSVTITSETPRDWMFEMLRRSSRWNCGRFLAWFGHDAKTISEGVGITEAHARAYIREMSGRSMSSGGVL